MLDLILSLLLGVFVIALSVWGGVVSARSLPPIERPVHIWGFGVTGLVAVILTISIGVRNYLVQKEAARQQLQLADSLQDTVGKLANNNRSLEMANQTLQQSRNSEEFMKGQLNGLSLVVGKIGSNGDTASASLAQALHEISREDTRPAQPLGQSGLRQLSNMELKIQAVAMASSIRQIEDQYERENSAASNVRFDTSKNQTGQQFSENLMATYELAHQHEMTAWNPLHVRCGVLINEMLSRLPQGAVPKDQMELSTVNMAVSSDSLAGAYPLRTVADYVEKLALLFNPPKSLAKHRR